MVRTRVTLAGCAPVGAANATTAPPAQAVEQVGAEQVPDDEVGFPTTLRLDRGDQFRKRRAQGNKGEPDDQLRHTQVGGDRRRIDHQQLRPGQDTGQAKHSADGLEPRRWRPARLHRLCRRRLFDLVCVFAGKGGDLFGELSVAALACPAQQQQQRADGGQGQDDAGGEVEPGPDHKPEQHHRTHG
jgi:hypothetical protein